MNLTQELIGKGFIKNVTIKNDTFLIVNTPCRIKVIQKEVTKLRTNYLDNEEIGGVMRAKPTILNGERIFVIEEVKFVRNAIEDKPHYDKKTGRLLTKEHAYLLDSKEFADARKQFFELGCLPIRFHSHPTRGRNIFDGLMNQQLQTDTSEQDQIESKSFDLLENQKILMPRGLIVGNKDLGNDLFIGFYDGFIAPLGFDESKRKVHQEQINRLGNSISEKVSSWNLSDEEKIIYGIGGALILGYLLYKGKKFSFPVIIGLAVVVPVLLTNTGSIEKPNYFNKLSFGDADIYLPKEDGEFYPKTQ
ncbi:MAG: hypothetical protein Q8M29_04615 [Bacteroidota bacterium]|nr:hypothetical protein [Bacteroidota bacterium]